jgi:hypothetical protein
MKRLMIWIVAFMFLITASAFAQEKSAAPATDEKMVTAEQKAEKKVVKKAKKPKKAKKAKKAKKEKAEEEKAPAPEKQ